MNHWAFVLSAYAATLGGAGALALASWRAMARAERLASGGAESPASDRAGR